MIVPALLAGNAVLVKHARLTPLCADHFVDAFAEDRACPPACIAATPMDHALAAKVIRSGQVDYVSFTGSVEGGREVHGHVASRFIDAGLELGGKDPAYVADDANFAFAVENLVDGAFYNAGQSCCGIERIYVSRSLFSRFVDAYVDLVRRYRMGDPEDPATTLGPCAERKVVETVQGPGRAGARGGRPRPRRRRAVEGPRLLLRARRAGGRPPRDARDVGGELRAGHRPHARWPTTRRRCRLMNDSPYGLTASVWTEDPARAERLMDQLDAGTVYANRCDYLDPLLPWVGVKDSGKGCSLSHLGFRHLTRPKSFHLRTLTA